MSVKKEFKAEVSRKSDKMIDTHREFLDMDTDEEDFGRQESSEIEEELPLEPAKPIYREEDLIILVRHVKNLTIFDSDGTNWNENCDVIIREYFENPSHVLLSIFYDGNKLAAILNIPPYTSMGFVYFLRSPWYIYTPENFLNTVLFGSITKDIGSFVLKFIENIYAPIVLHNDDYTPFIKNDVFSNLHKFIIRLTEEVYRPIGLTTLYVPKESLLETFLKSSDKIDYFLLGENKKGFNFEDDERKQKLICRLENVVWSWIKQIDSATRIEMTKKTIRSIYDEVNYWNAKYTNFKYLRVQILNPEVRLIIDMLKKLHSPNANKFEKLIKSIKSGLKMASSNLMYLNVLSDFCRNLNVPKDAKNSITEALFLILFIWTESPFYSITNNIQILCQALSLQVIHQCKKYINLDVALGSNPEEGKRMLQECILCCNIYKTIYDNLITNVVPYINLNKKWDVKGEEVFDTIDTFKQRCYNVIEICQTLIIFGRYNKIGILGSPKGIEYEEYWREIENIFYKSLNEIIASCDIIFDIMRSSWLKKIKQFRYTIQQLENMVINLINDIFKYVKNVEEGIEAIYALQKFKKRKIFQEILHNKWIQIWKIFNDEIEYCYTNVIDMSRKCDRSTNKSNVYISILCILQYLESQYNIMMSALDWIRDCPIKKCVLERYKQVIDVIDERRKMFNTYNTYRT